MTILPFKAALAAMLLSMGLMPAIVRADAIEDRVRQEMVRSDVPGVAVAIVRDGQPLRIEGFGFANIEHQVPVHPDTLFKTGALGMQFTAAGVLLLAEEGKLDLDASVRRYLPELPQSWQPVSLRRMLNHTSGLPATPNGDFRVEYSDVQMLDIIAHEKLNFPAGARWRFSYVDYVVLGQVMARVTGQPYARFLVDRIFAPLGMTRARGIDEMAIIANRSAGYERRDGHLRNAEWISAAANSTADGSLYLSALDYAAWAAAMSRQSLLARSSWAAMGQPARLGNGAACHYGLGWYLDDRAWWHGGSWQGFQTFAIRYLKPELTVVVLANGEGADAEGLARDLAGLVEPALARQDAAPILDTDPAMTAQVAALLDAVASNRVAAHDFADYAALDLKEMVAQYSGLLQGLGARKDLALFAKADQCGETLWRYRAHYRDQVIELRLVKAANGRIGNLEIVPVNRWVAPL